MADKVKGLAEEEMVELEILNRTRARTRSIPLGTNQNPEGVISNEVTDLSLNGPPPLGPGKIPLVCLASDRL
jgi:hypothetical protein